MASEIPNAISAAVMPTSGMRRSGIRCRRNATPSGKAISTPTTAPPMTKMAASPKIPPFDESVPRKINSKAMTASIAPIGSMTMLSHLRTDDTSREGRTEARIGAITVGPDTTRMAPTSSATSGGSPRNAVAAKDPSTQVTATPAVTSSQITLWFWRSSRRCRLSPPSKRIRPTEIETAGSSRSPARASGSTIPATGPTITPAPSSRTIDGIRNRAAAQVANTATATIDDSSKTGDSMVGAR